MSDYKPKIGDVWRKHGPCDWVKIVSRQWDGFPEYDGALKGCSIVMTNLNGNWKRQGVFWPCNDPDEFASDMKKHFRTLDTQTGLD
jgi:hypothetical protein